MNKVIMIHQPDFIPWLGFINRWKKSDLLIILDDVQLLRRGWHNRDKIKTSNGSQWLTVPCLKKGAFEQTILETLIDYSSNFEKKHLNTLKVNYQKSKNFKLIFPEIESLYNEKPDKLIDFNLSFLKLASRFYNIKTPYTFASKFNITTTKTQRLIDLIKEENGTHYLTGMGSKDYLDENKFRNEKLEVVWDSYVPGQYLQQFGEFEQGMSFLDHLFNVDLNDLWQGVENEI